jgi:hypothetical protein
MDSDNRPTHEEKKAYRRPELVVHGSIAELTQTAATGAKDDVSGGKRS